MEGLAGYVMFCVIGWIAAERLKRIAIALEQIAAAIKPSPNVGIKSSPAVPPVGVPPRM